MKLDIIVDNPNSWFWEYIPLLIKILKRFGVVRVFKSSKEIKRGDILFILSCDKILKKELKLHTKNIVIHESDLPKGKGWSPVSYQVEKGKKQIPITLFEADKKVDSGKWYLKDKIKLNGYELIDKIRKKQALKTINIIKSFLLKNPKPKKQLGKSSFYKKRDRNYQKIEIDRKTFNKLRVCDNDRYPAWFEIDGKKYFIKVYL